MNQQLQRIRNKLTLDKAGGWVGGVCAGFARFFNIEPIYMRGGVVIIAVFFPKTVIVAYVLLWLLLYQRKREDSEV